jgi:hypothetical protein
MRRREAISVAKEQCPNKEASVKFTENIKIERLGRCAEAI